MEAALLPFHSTSYDRAEKVLLDDLNAPDACALPEVEPQIMTALCPDVRRDPFEIGVPVTGGDRQLCKQLPVSPYRDILRGDRCGCPDHDALCTLQVAVLIGEGIAPAQSADMRLSCERVRIDLCALLRIPEFRRSLRSQITRRNGFAGNRYRLTAPQILAGSAQVNVIGTCFQTEPLPGNIPDLQFPEGNGLVKDRRLSCRNMQTVRGNKAARPHRRHAPNHW